MNTTKNHKKLNIVINETYYANGKPSLYNDSITDIQEIIGEKKFIMTKDVPTLGSDLKKCSLSDTVSIDIDPESTLLPLMCKLMIIVQGAILERGTRVLVRDAQTQTIEEIRNNFNNDIKQKVDHSELCDSERYRISFQRHIKFENSGKYRSSINLNLNDNNSANYYGVSNKFGGSLSNLHKSILINTPDSSLYKNTIKKSLFNSFNNLSVPYYLYQSKKFSKHDFSINTRLSSFNLSGSYNCLVNKPKIFEIGHYHEKIKHRNEKFVYIDNDFPFDSISFLEAKKQEIENRLRNIFSENRFKSNSQQILIDYMNPVFNNQSNEEYLLENNNNNAVSVTNLIMMQLVDGRLIK